MRIAHAAVIASLCAATIASAQYKKQNPTPPPPSAPIAPSTPAALESARRINHKDAMKFVAEGKAVYVDVRSKEQYDQGHIKGAISIPGSQLIARLREVPPGKMIITYCAWTAEQSSARAVLDLNARGMKNAAALVGGWTEWQANRLPTEVTKK